MRVGVAVIADVVAVSGNAFYIIGEIVNPFPDKKKRSLNLVFVKNFQQVFRLLVAPRRVKGNRNLLFVALNAVNGNFSRFSCCLYRLNRRGNSHRRGGNSNHKA